MPDIDTYALHFLFSLFSFILYITYTYLKYLDSHSTEAAVAHTRFSYIFQLTPSDSLSVFLIPSVLCFCAVFGQTAKHVSPRSNGRSQSETRPSIKWLRIVLKRNACEIFQKDIYCTAQEQCTFPRYWYLSHSIKYIHLLIQHQTRLYYLYMKAACAFISSWHRQRSF